MARGYTKKSDESNGDNKRVGVNPVGSDVKVGGRRVVRAEERICITTAGGVGNAVER